MQNNSYYSTLKLLPPFFSPVMSLIVAKLHRNISEASCCMEKISSVNFAPARMPVERSEQDGLFRLSRMPKSMLRLTGIFLECINRKTHDSAPVVLLKRKS